MVNRIAVIFRSYAKKEEVAGEVVERALASARKATTLNVHGDRAFSRVVILVPTDYDYGGTADRIRKAIIRDGIGISAEVMEANGHHSCEALNSALTRLDEDGEKYAVIMSNKSLGYLSSRVMEEVLNSLEKGAKVVGVQIKELSDVEEQPIENTFAAWDIPELLSVGGFDSKIGVEEVAPMVRLMQKYDACATIVRGIEGSLNVRQSEDGKARHSEVRETKSERQATEASRLGVTLDWIRSKIVSA